MISDLCSERFFQALKGAPYPESAQTGLRCVAECLLCMAQQTLKLVTGGSLLRGNLGSKIERY
jgi:hypothetical protein